MNSLFSSLLQKQTKEAANQGQKFYSASPNTLFLTLMFFYQIIKKNLWFFEENFNIVDDKI